MTSLLLFVLQVLVLLHEQLEPVQASFSVALPLAVRSPYLSCWLPQVNGSDNGTVPYHISATRSNLSQVCLSRFLLFDLRLTSLFYIFLL